LSETVDSLLDWAFIPETPVRITPNRLIGQAPLRNFVDIKCSCLRGADRFGTETYKFRRQRSVFVTQLRFWFNELFTISFWLALTTPGDDKLPFAIGLISVASANFSF
jgi:hypothetical protein